MKYLKKNFKIIIAIVITAIICVSTTVYAGSSDTSYATFRLNCSGFEGYVMIS